MNHNTVTKRFLLTFVTFVFCVPCFAEDLPSVPELIKRMYDYRMAIENMRAEVTVTKLVDTRQPIRESETQHFHFAFDRGRVRCDRIFSNSETSQSRFYQDLSTPEFHFTRHPYGIPDINDGSSLFLNSPLTQTFDTLDPRRIGTDWASFDTIVVNRFNYDTLLDQFYNANGENYSVSIDLVDNEELYKVSYQVRSVSISNSYWINPRKGYNLVRCESASEELGMYISYVVTLDKFAANNGEIWFPQEIFYKRRVRDNVFEEKIVLESVVLDVRDETPFTLAGLGIPVGYRVEYFEEGARYWDGMEFVKDIPFEIESISITSRKAFWIINAIGFALIALWILIKLLQRRSK